MSEHFQDTSPQNTTAAEVNNKQKRLPLGIILIGSLAGGYLFNVNDLAINVVIFFGLLATMFVFTHRPTTPKIKYLSFIVMGSFLVLSFAWRESSVLLRINTVALLSLLLITINRNNYKDRSHFFLIDLINASYVTIKKLFLVPVSESRKEIKQLMQQPQLTTKIWELLRGLAISLPFVILAGTILTSADTRFSNYIDALFDFELSIPFIIIPIITSYFIVVAFLTSSKAYKPLPWYDKFSGSFYLSGIEVVTILTSLNTIFTLYIYVQLSYYFGDDAMIRSTTNIAYSEYARTGFFLLVSLSVVVLGFLWCLSWLIRRDKQSVKRWFKVMSLIMISLLTVIEASAIHRMTLYTNAYGLTEARFYAYALMFWVGLIYIIFILTILRSKRGNFLASTLISGIGIVIVLNFINPAGLIANYNLKHVDKILLDTRYLLTLGPDAHPAILGNLDSINSNARCIAIRSVQQSIKRNSGDWRIWSWGVYQSKRSLLNLKLKCPL